MKKLLLTLLGNYKGKTGVLPDIKDKLGLGEKTKETGKVNSNPYYVKYVIHREN